jgi:lipopolysaccharide heptosyltransferase II
MTINPEEIKKILCIKPRGIGDILLSTIILSSLKQRFPAAAIHYLTEEFAAPVLYNNPFVEKVLTMGKTEFPLWVALRLRKEKYDLVLDLWSNPRSAQITFLSGAKYRAGFAYRGRKYAYNIKATSDRGDYHSAEHNLKILEPLGAAVINQKIHYYVSDEENSEAVKVLENLFAPGEQIIGIIPSGGWPSKRCDAEKWVEFCTEINKRSGSRFLILWGPGDEKDADYIVKHLPGYAVLAPATDLRAMSALINNCDMILANDSGPMHISAALGIPTLGIFGPTNPIAHGPYAANSDYINIPDLFCIICNKLECLYNHECMRLLKPEDVAGKLEKIAADSPAK